MPLFSVVYSYVQGTYGWTEKWFFNGESNNLNDYWNKCVQLLIKRMALCGKETIAQYMRVSQEGVQGDSLLFGIVSGQILSNQQVASAPPPVCALATFRDQTNQFQKKMFMRGIWNTVQNLGGQYIPTPEWTAAFNAFGGMLVAEKFGWEATVRPSTKRTITAITQQPNGLIRITADPPNWPGPFPMPKQQVRISGVVGAATANGLTIVTPTSPTIAESAKPIAILPYSSGGSMRYGTHAFKEVWSYFILRIGRHDTGRPILQPRGRQKARVRG